MIRFIDGRARTAEAPDADTLRAALLAADPEWWNGATGMSTLVWQDGAKDQAIFVSLAPGHGYHLVFTFTDGSRLSAIGDAPPETAPVTLWWGGQPAEVPADRFVGAEAAAAILAHFLRTGEPDFDAAWGRIG